MKKVIVIIKKAVKLLFQYLWLHLLFFFTMSFGDLLTYIDADLRGDTAVLLYLVLANKLLFEANALTAFLFKKSNKPFAIIHCFFCEYCALNIVLAVICFFVG